MKFYTPDKSLLIDVQAIKEHHDGIAIEGKIMGAMPMKAVLRPEELRGAFRLLTFKLLLRLLMMLIRGERATRKF